MLVLEIAGGIFLAWLVIQMLDATVGETQRRKDRQRAIERYLSRRD